MQDTWYNKLIIKKKYNRYGDRLKREKKIIKYINMSENRIKLWI